MTTIVQKNYAFIGSIAALFAVLSFGVASVAHAATIDRQLDLGSTGQEVTDLQNYLSTDASLYPSGRVTGYFGSLTQGGVQRFQVAQDIVSSGSPSTTGYGRVGPTTMNRLNSLMGGSNVSGVAGPAPSLSAINVQRNATTLTFSWSTDQPSIGQIYWSTNGIQSDEATGPRQMPYVSGTLALDAGGLQYNHSITVSNLQPNTTYYYFMRSINNLGDMSVALTNTVQTTQ